jgi:hypothetical protein
MSGIRDFIDSILDIINDRPMLRFILIVGSGASVSALITWLWYVDSSHISISALMVGLLSWVLWTWWSD